MAIRYSSNSNRERSLTNKEEVIDRVECVNGASASHRYDCSADFTLKHIAVGAR